MCIRDSCNLLLLLFGIFHLIPFLLCTLVCSGYLPSSFFVSSFHIVIMYVGLFFLTYSYPTWVFPYFILGFNLVFITHFCCIVAFSVLIISSGYNGILILILIGFHLDFSLIVNLLDFYL